MARRSPFGAGRGRARTRTRSRSRASNKPKRTNPIVEAFRNKDPEATRKVEEKLGGSKTYGRTPGGSIEQVVGAKTTTDADKFLERMEGRSVDLGGGKITPAKAMEMRAKGQAVPTSMLPLSERGPRYTDTAQGRIYKGNWYDSKGQLRAPEEIDKSGGRESSPAPTMSRGEGTKFFGSFGQPERFQDAEKTISPGSRKTPASIKYGEDSTAFEKAQTARVKTPAAKQARARVKKAGGIGLPPGYAKPEGDQLRQRQKLAERIMRDISTGAEPEPEGTKVEKFLTGLGSGLRSLLTGKGPATRRREAADKREASYIEEGAAAGLDERLVKSFLQKQRAKAASAKAKQNVDSARQASIDKQNELMKKDDATALLQKQVADLIKKQADEAKEKKDEDDK